jgi:dTDP-4-amino-4,6-dideoxygalactose transaminase
MTHDILFEFEEKLSRFTGSPYVVATDGCTHALELCFRYDRVEFCAFTPFTYLSILMLMRQLKIQYQFEDTGEWIGEYRFRKTRIWDSAKLLRFNMYRPGQVQCLSFGHSKPLQLGRVGAILTDDKELYSWASLARSDGRDLRISPWQQQSAFVQGYHYCPTLEDCQRGIERLSFVDQEPKYHEYPDLRNINVR